MNKQFISKSKNICCAFLKTSAENPLPAIVLLFLIVLALGVLTFYRYDVLAEKSETKTSGEGIQFQTEFYQQILKEWQVRDQRFEGAGFQKYINPFQEKREKLILTVPEEPKAVVADPKLLDAANLLDFYALKGEKMPLLNTRAKMWQEFGLGSLQSYVGSNAQNQLLLAELKKRLTE